MGIISDFIPSSKSMFYAGLCSIIFMFIIIIINRVYISKKRIDISDYGEDVEDSVSSKDIIGSILAQYSISNLIVTMYFVICGLLANILQQPDARRILNIIESSLRISDEMKNLLQTILYAFVFLFCILIRYIIVRLDFLHINLNKRCQNEINRISSLIITIAILMICIFMPSKINSTIFCMGLGYIIGVFASFSKDRSVVENEIKRIIIINGLLIMILTFVSLLICYSIDGLGNKPACGLLCAEMVLVVTVCPTRDFYSTVLDLLG